MVDDFGACVLREEIAQGLNRACKSILGLDHCLSHCKLTYGSMFPLEHHWGERSPGVLRDSLPFLSQLETVLYGKALMT